MDREKLMAMARAARRDGEGTGRRRRKVAPRRESRKDDNYTFEERFKSTCAEIGLSPVCEITEAFVFLKDDTVMRFFNPSVLQCTSANTWVVSGTPHVQSVQDMFTGIMRKFGSCNWWLKVTGPGDFGFTVSHTAVADDNNSDNDGDTNDDDNDEESSDARSDGSTSKR